MSPLCFFGVILTFPKIPLYLFSRKFSGDCLWVSFRESLPEISALDVKCSTYSGGKPKKGRIG